MTERHVCDAACRPLEEWQAARVVARRRLASLRPAGVTSRMRPLTELERWLVTQPGRCPECAGHIATQGHDAGCLFGPRANLTLTAAGTFLRNARPAT